MAIKKGVKILLKIELQNIYTYVTYKITSKVPIIFNIPILRSLSTQKTHIYSSLRHRSQIFTFT